METKSIHLKIADYEICPIPTGLFALDGGAMFGTVPRVLWEKSNPPDAQNRIPMEARALLLKSAKRNILIDTGNGADFVAKFGEKLGNKFSQMYAVDDSGPNLISSLRKFQISPEQITDVILTHLHFDHAGGGTTERDGKLVPTFANARYYIQEKNLATATKPNLREKASYFPANYQALLESGNLQILKGEVTDLLPHVSLVVSNGHTQGQQLVKVSDGKTTLLYCADLIPTSSHVRLPWIMGYDLNPLLLMEEKAKILSEACAQNWYLYFEHDPYCDMATVEENGADFKVKDFFKCAP